MKVNAVFLLACMSLGNSVISAADVAADFAAAQTTGEKGLAIGADRRDSGFGDSTADLEMVLKSLTIFDMPADVKGTALLTFSHKTGNDDQWLYLPALKRVKRISSSNKSGPFMGSEFAYEDISSEEVEKYTYRYIRDEDFDGQATFVVERYPVDKKSGYTRQVVWVDRQSSAS